MPVMDMPVKLMEKGMTSLDKRTPTFALLAKSTCEITFSTETETAFDNAATVIERMDYIYDNPKYSELRSKALEELAYALGLNTEYELAGDPVLGDVFSEAVELRERITDEQANTFFNLGLETIRITTLMRQTRELSEFIKLRRRESQLTRQMFFSLIPENEKKQPNFPEFEDFITGGWAMGNLLDSALDLPQDFKSRITNIDPSIANRLRLFGNALIDTKDTFAYFGFGRSIGIIRRLLKEQKANQLYIATKQPSQ